MQFNLSDKTPATQDAAQLIIIGKSKIKNTLLNAWSKEEQSLINTMIQHCQKSDTPFQAALLPAKSICPIAVLCLDDEAKTLEKISEKTLQPISQWLKNQKIETINIYLDGISNKTAQHKIIDLIPRLIGNTFYAYNECKKEAKSATLQTINLICANAKNFQATLNQALILKEAMDFARDLGNAPGNICTPTYLAETAKLAAQKVGAKIRIHSEKQIKKLEMNSFLSVAKGSQEPPQFIELHYLGAQKNDAPIVLVGKGITFDSGGISLKPGAGMDEMKYDMCGAATVIATFCAAAKLKLPLNLIALVPTCENMPSGIANKPGDIVRAMNGLSIEILNTDAEGRLILCDALSYAERFKPQAVIDVATLTGACIIALGHSTSGLIGNNPELINKLLSAGEKAADKAWNLPLSDEYKELLQSNFADLANIGGRPAGTITAAAFLSHFTEKYPWAHLDIAGTAWTSGQNKGATGRPVPLLLNYLIQAAQS